MTIKNIKKQKLHDNIDEFFKNSYFDVQGITPGINSLDEAYLARILTKLAISSATIWWSILEVKDFFNLRRKSKSL
jgi:hypothetical protein